MMFPKPQCMYTDETPGIFWLPLQVPETSSKKSNDIKVPCRLIKSPTPTGNLLIYFHGNAEDIGDSEQFLRPLANAWKVDLSN